MAKNNMNLGSGEDKHNRLTKDLVASNAEIIRLKKINDRSVEDLIASNAEIIRLRKTNDDLTKELFGGFDPIQLHLLADELIKDVPAFNTQFFTFDDNTVRVWVNNFKLTRECAEPAKVMIVKRILSLQTPLVSRNLPS